MRRPRDDPENRDGAMKIVCVNCEAPFQGEAEKPGGIAICLSCYQLLAFNEDGTLRLLTAPEMMEAAHDETIQDVLRNLIASARER